METMKLAAALIMRKELRQKLNELAVRIGNNAISQEGDEPLENPTELLRQLQDANQDLIGLVQAINRTNMTVQMADGRTIADALAERDGLIRMVRTLRDIADKAAVEQVRYSLTEIRQVSRIDAAEVQARIDRMAERARRLDLAIQELNWTTDLIVG